MSWCPRPTLASFAVLLGLAGAGESGTESIPENAHAKGIGYGWECDFGYRKIADGCEAIRVPEHGFLIDSDYGRGWECHRGYRAHREDCVAIDVPSNAFLSGTRTGTGWECERGYKVVNEICEPVDVPDNAHLNRYGNDWVCNRPYVKRSGRCVPN